ncbi:MAG: hypothetical protein GY754_38770 [bacterium]|nr:hypothetical protein [bacterium]
MKKIAVYLIPLVFLLMNCEMGPLSKAQDYKSNNDPVITGFTASGKITATDADWAVGDIIEPMTVTLTASAYDPEGTELQYTFEKLSADVGQLGEQTDSDDGSSRTYSMVDTDLNGHSGESLSVRVTVTDAKGGSSSQDLVLGIVKGGPTLTILESGTQNIGANSITTIRFRHNSDGEYRILVNDAYGTNLFGAGMKYDYVKNTEVTKYLLGPDHSDIGDTLYKLPSTNGNYTVEIIAIDSLDQEVSETLTYNLDIDPPSVSSFRINNNNTKAASSLVWLNSSVSGATQMQFSNNNSTWSSWESYSSWRSNYTLNSSSPTVYARYRDDHSNETTVVSDSISIVSDDCYEENDDFDEPFDLTTTFDNGVTGSGESFNSDYPELGVLYNSDHYRIYAKTDQYPRVSCALQGGASGYIYMEVTTSSGGVVYDHEQKPVGAMENPQKSQNAAWIPREDGYFIIHIWGDNNANEYDMDWDDCDDCAM